ncbi:MAG: hypothetical protein KatS3mg015_0428 [Fimbriimonadales bacterium]|nr:MAG: hypothetical protein KatS3mg015_0428 [Fimbriimonadales bacterium]
MNPRRTVKFAFGHHKHWTGMVWEWGEDTLTVSVQSLRIVLDQLPLIAGLNFDGKGIEYLAERNPASIEWLRDALGEGRVELWGGTYTQPYGHMIGHESNVRQRQTGVAAFRRILGERPRVFVEEEFDLFPQLPQMLTLLEYEGAMLFPQHTWHTPTIPETEEEVVSWMSPDGSSLPTIPYSRRCLMRGIPTALDRLDDPLLQEDGSLLVTWLEVLDKPNWMWRSEFVLPYLRALLENDKNVRIEPTTLLAFLQERAPSRKLLLPQEETFHGISVGKNGDALPRLWRSAEGVLLTAEHLSAWCSLLGRPYPQFDAYPEWQLAEAWRFLMQSQGHDAYECEGLTHRAGRRYAQMATMLAKDVLDRAKTHLKQKDLLRTADAEAQPCPFQVLPDGRVADELGILEPCLLPIGWRRETEVASAAGSLRYDIGSEWGAGVQKVTAGADGILRIQTTLALSRLPEAGILQSIRLSLTFRSEPRTFRADSPFLVTTVRPSGRWIHRQPTGDWLTSPQWEEWIENPLTFLTFFTVQTDRGEVLFASKQNTLALVRENAVEVVLFTRDAWDEDAVDRRATLDSAVALLPADATNLDRLVTAARAFLHPLHPSLATRNGLSFASIQGPAFVTCVRKEGEDVEVRLFETEGSAGEALLEFPWHVESATRVNLVGAEDGDLSPEFEDRRIALPLRPHQIVTLRIRFQGIRTQYPDIDRYRDVWVG